ncbi:MAG: hypothetical protein L0Y80_10930 [Ignavibacteriae bacterium]|nr:hypothetical protein [Ignavibacteriota bacterium]
MKAQVLNKLKLILLKRVDVLIWREYHQTLSEVLNELYVRNLCVRPNLTIDETFLALRKHRILCHIPGPESKELQDAVERIVSGTYGFCQECKRELDEQELEEHPTRRHCAICEQRSSSSYRVTLELMKSISLLSG